MSDIGNRIKTRRKECGLKQGDLAGLLEVSPKTISAWEVGRNEPNLDVISRIADVLQCSVQELTGTEEKPNTSDAERSGSITCGDIIGFIIDNPQYHDLLVAASHVPSDKIGMAIGILKVLASQ